MAMLDNLKLGYGGTKEELKRLIEDAASYTEIQKEMGIEVDRGSTSFANIVNAIAVVQKKLGIAGATAAEAATTIEGSLNSAKAAWKNLVTAMADDTQDFNDKMDRFVETLVGDKNGQGGFVNNILPRFAQALNGVGKLIERMAPILVEKLPKIIEDIFPTLLSSAGKIIEKLIVALPQLIKGTLPTFIDAIGDIVGTLLDALPSFVDAIADILPTVIEQIGRLFTEKDLVGRFIKAITGIIQAISNNLEPIVDAVVTVLPDIMESIGMAISQNLPELINSIAGLISKAISTIFEVVLRPDVFESVLDGVSNVTVELAKNLPRILLEPIKIFFEETLNGFQTLWERFWNGDFDSLFVSENPSTKVRSAITGQSMAVSQSAAGDFNGESVFKIAAPETNSIGEVNIVIEGPVEDPAKTGKTIAEQLKEIMNRRGAANGAY